MLISIDAASDRPIFEQIADSVRRAIASRALTAGDKLPTAHEVALGLGVNKHTVLHAFQSLRDEGLIDLRRGRGAVVTDIAAAIAELTGEVRVLAKRAASLGVGAEILAAIVAHEYERERAEP